MVDKTQITLYGDLFSQPVRAVYSFLKLNNIEFNHINIDLVKGEHKDP